MTDTSLENIAKRLETAAKKSPEDYRTVIGELWSDEGAMVRHEPAMPHDGTAMREQILAAQKFQTDTMRKAAPDYRYEAVSTKVSDQTVHLNYTQAATLADGTRFSAPIAARFYFRAGKIHEAVLGIDPRKNERMIQLLQEAGAPVGQPARH